MPDNYSAPRSARNLLVVEASARGQESDSRKLADLAVARFGNGGPVDVVRRDVSTGLPFVDEAWVNANFTPEADRTSAQRDVLSLSDSLVDELQSADAVVIATPIYNFGVPAALKAWIDQVARAGVTFRYTENGPVGLLEGKKAIVLITSGGTAVGSDADFVSGYMRHVLGFVGIHDVEVIAADQLMIDATRLDAAKAQVSALAA